MKTKQFFSLAALALMMAACSSDDIATSQSDTKVRTVPFKAVISADAGTRGLSEATDGNTITVDWEKDEQVALVHGLNIDILKVESVDGGNATISGDITDPTDGESVFVVYAGQSSEAMSDFKDILEAYADDQGLTAYSEANINLILENQFEAKVSGGALDGTVESISQLVDQRLGSGALAVSDKGASFKDNVKLTTKYAIWKLSLSDGTNALKAKELTIKNGNTNIAYFKSESGASDFYVPFAPASEASFAFEALVGEDTYTYSAEKVTLAAGKFYASTLTMTEVNNKYLVYDSSGKATATDIPSDATAITSTTTTWAKGTYVVSEDVTIAGDVTLSGDVNLILKDGVTLTVNGKIAGGQSITIYGQTESTGKLSASGGDEEIAILAKNLTVHGGVITVPEAGQGIETGGVLTVYNGTINTTGTLNGFMILGGMYVYGGEVTATSTDGAAISLYKEGSSEECDLTIAGGKVTATNTGSAAGIETSSNSNIVITGGTLTAQGGDNFEGILTFGTCTIDGGVVNAYAGESGVGLEGKIIVNDGTVTAIGGDAKEGSGAAGGVGIDGALTVTGGTVTAKGGNGADASEGDGGRGGDGINGNVSVTGGTVTATGGNGGSTTASNYDGGSGGYGVRGTVTGTVTATGGSGGAAGEGGIGGEVGQTIGE